jgi:hypothetical protein
VARRIIAEYAVFHNVGGKSEFSFYYDVGLPDTLSGVPIAEARHIIDLLRNEGPVGYDAALKRLSTTSGEPVGEGE